MSIMDTIGTHLSPAPQPSPYQKYIGTIKYVDTNVYIDASGNKVTQSKTFNVTLYDYQGATVKHYNNHVGFHVDFIV